MSEKDRPTMKDIEGMLADYVTVTIKLPKAVAEWFKLCTTDLPNTLAAELVELCYAEVDSADRGVLMGKFGLTPVFKEYGLISK